MAEDTGSSSIQVFSGCSNFTCSHTWHVRQSAAFPYSAQLREAPDSVGTLNSERVSLLATTEKPFKENEEANQEFIMDLRVDGLTEAQIHALPRSISLRFAPRATPQSTYAPMRKAWKPMEIPRRGRQLKSGKPLRSGFFLNAKPDSKVGKIVHSQTKIRSLEIASLYQPNP